MTTPRDQANAFILALETELPGLGSRGSRQLLSELAREWADGQQREPLRGPVERLARALGITGPRNAVERALAAVEAEQVAAIREAGRQVRADERAKAVRP